MQNRQNGRRRRGSGGNNPRPMGQAMSGQSASRLEVRVRGNAHQLLEKYKQLARDAHQAGDRVASEYYLQHSDHYFRVLNDSRIRQEEMRARRGVFDQFEDEPAVPEAADSAADSDGELPEQPARTERGQAGERGQSGERGQAGTGERPRRWSERRGEQRERPVREQPVREQDEPVAVPSQVLELHLSDGEAALMAFGGSPVRDEQAAAAETTAEEAPKPRRRGRPRKVETAES